MTLKSVQEKSFHLISRHLVKEVISPNENVRKQVMKYNNIHVYHNHCLSLLISLINIFLHFLLFHLLPPSLSFLPFFHFSLPKPFSLLHPTSLSLPLFPPSPSLPFISLSSLHLPPFLPQQSHHSLELLAKITGKSVTEIMEPHREILADMIPPKKHLLKHQPVSTQIALMDGNTFCTSLSPRLFSIDLSISEHTVFFQEV